MKRACLECGKEHSARQVNSRFCCKNCKIAFNNRRQTRGAILYDLLMIAAHEPDTAARLDMIDRHKHVLNAFKDEDAKERAGRKSWKAPYDVHIDTARYRLELLE